MVTRTLIVNAPEGLHARPASIFTVAAAQSGAAVTVTYGEKSANAASILEVLSLGVSAGAEITLSVEGDGAEAVLDELISLLETLH